MLLLLLFIITNSTLFWIDAGDNTRPPKIESSAMDGSKRKVIISEHLGTPRAITVDYSIGESEGRIYWTDQLHRRIESASLNGSERRAIEGRNNTAGIVRIFHGLNFMG